MGVTGRTASLALALAVGCGGGDGGFMPDDGGGNGPDASGDASTGVDSSADAGGNGLDFGIPSDPECDLNGYWAVRQTTISRALMLDQVAHNWYFMVLSQEGEEVRVVDHLDCGAAVQGSVAVSLPRETMVNLSARNLQTGRKGRMARSGAQCEFSLERFWSVRGADPDTYLPNGRDWDGELSALQASTPMPSAAMPEGAEDWNAPEYAMPGIGWVIRGIVSGTRWSVQRDWTQWASNANHPIEAGESASEVTAGVIFNNEENVLSTAPPNNPTVGSSATAVSRDARNQVTLKRLGTSAEDAEVARLLALGVGARCLEVQAILPSFKP